MTAGVNKKLLETLKGGELTKETLGPCIASFRALLESNLSPDLLRSLALSITYNLHRPKPSSTLQKKKSIRFATSSPRPPSSSSDPGKHVSGITLGIEILRLYSTMLCNVADPTPLRKFAKAVTNKVRRGVHVV
jgi:hypothetical protein